MKPDFEHGRKDSRSQSRHGETSARACRVRFPSGWFKLRLNEPYKNICACITALEQETYKICHGKPQNLMNYYSSTEEAARKH